MWFFYAPNLIFGDGALDHLEQIPGTKCFVVTDPGIVQAGLLEILTKKLDACGKSYEVFSEVEPDPHEETIYRAAEQCRAYEPDIIIGLGGGSSLDSAKCVWVFYERPDLKTVDEIHPFQQLNTGVKAKLVAIPTTSGTGAETTSAVVVTRINPDGVAVKLEQLNKEVIPTYAIVDPVFPKGMPAKLTTATAFDALGHCLECLVSTWRNVFSDAFAVHATKMIFEYLPRVVKDPSDLEAREQMHNAATMAGLAFGNSQVHIGHGIAHVLGAVFHVPHGVAVGLTIPGVMEYVINNPDDPASRDKYSWAAKALGVASWDDEPAAAAKKLVEKVRELQSTCGFPLTLRDAGVTREQLDDKIEQVTDLCLQSGAVVMCPRPIRKETFRKLVEYSFEGKPVDF
ncbi:MAG: iron-containing alcohol dehydrogenase [Promethearchaeota archaeon]